MQKLIQIIIALIIVLFSTNAVAGTGFFLEVREYAIVADKVKPNPKVNTFVTYQFTDLVGVEIFTVTKKGWAQARVGPSLTILYGLTLSAGFGLEQAATPLRGAVSVSWKIWRLGLFACGEYGGSGHYYIGNADVQATDWFAIGAFAERFAGVGPRMKFKILKTPLTVWIAGTHDFEFDANKIVTSIVFAVF